MWVLLIVIYTTTGAVTSQQIEYPTRESCVDMAQRMSEQRGWLGYDSGFVVATTCVEVPK